MQIRLLAEGYKKNEDFYKDFLNGTLMEKESYFSERTIEIDQAGDFPIYMGRATGDERKKLFLTAFEVLARDYLKTPREIHMDELFWHSLICTVKRDYVLAEYPMIKESIEEFNNIVLKKFDWENYIYKCILGAQYVVDNSETEEEEKKYYELIVDNLDIYNYILKYAIFRNDKFLIRILEIIDEEDLSDIVKAKIKNRPDLGKDERYGRRVIFEFNKSYPIVMAPMLEKKELKRYFIDYLKLYYDGEIAGNKETSSYENN